MLRLSGLSVLAEQILFELDISQTCPRLIPYPAEHIAKFFKKSFNFLTYGLACGKMVTKGVFRNGIYDQNDLIGK